MFNPTNFIKKKTTYILVLVLFLHLNLMNNTIASTAPQDVRVPHAIAIMIVIVVKLNLMEFSPSVVR